MGASGPGWSRAPAAPRTNPWAIGALVCGVLAFAAFGPLAGIPAIVAGHKALRQIRLGRGIGYGLAKAGLILGYLDLALVAVGVLLFLAFAHASPAPSPVRVG
jgi:tetrahydromethanopterin S-methyltransferase subunit C